MLDSNPGMWKLREIWNDSTEGKAAVITVAALAVGAVGLLVYLIVS